MTPKAHPERPPDKIEFHVLPALPEKPPTAPSEAEPNCLNDLAAWQSAGSDVRAILGAAGICLDSQDDPKEFHAPWARLFSLLSAYQPSRHLSQTTLDVLRAGAVKRLIRILRTCSVFELTLRRMRLPGNQPNLTWDLTVRVLALLSRRILDALKEKSAAPEIEQAWRDWKGSAEDIAFCYEHHNFSDPSQGVDGPDIHLAIAHVAMLLPLFDGRFENGVGHLDLSPERWKLFIPVLLSCRAQLATASPAENGPHSYDITRSIINCTTNLTACFQQALGLRKLSLERPKYRPEPLDVTKLAGMSCEALLQQNLTLCPNSLGGRPSTQIEIRLAQLDQIAILITSYATVDLMDALVPHNIFVYSAKIFKELRETQLWAVNKDPKRAPGDCYDRIAMLWCQYLEDSAYYKMNGRIAADVVDSNVLFLLESWSLHALNKQVGYVARITQSMAIVLVLCNDRNIHSKGVRQIRAISQRMSSRPDVRSKPAELWKKAYLELGVWRILAPSVVAGVSDMCAAIGCESVEPAGQRCGRCTKTVYCSKDCQRSDWSSHKPHCKPVPVPAPAPAPPSVPEPAPTSKSKSKKKAKNKKSIEPTTQDHVATIAPADAFPNISTSPDSTH